MTADGSLNPIIRNLNLDSVKMNHCSKGSVFTANTSEILSEARSSDGHLGKSCLSLFIIIIIYHYLPSASPATKIKTDG
jgi:hypothetical protein